MNPVFEVEGVPVVLYPLDMVSVAVNQMGEQVTSWAEQGQVIADALDELLTRPGGVEGLQEAESCRWQMFGEIVASTG